MIQKRHDTLVQKLVFCDEFGNTGPKLLETEQRVFVYAFVVIASSELARVEAEVKDVYESEGLPLTELKSSTLCSSRRGLQRYSAIGKIITDCDAQVCLSVVEKGYQACSMIVETFLDPELHENAPPELREPSLRQCFADACYDYLSNSSLEEFLSVVRADNPEQLAIIGQKLSTTLRLHPDEFVSFAACKMETRPAEVFRYSEKIPAVPRSAHLPASQYAAFYPGIQCLDFHLRANNVSAMLIRDQDSQFGNHLDFAFHCAKEVDQNLQAPAYGARLPLRQILSCREARSAEEFGIQLADLVAGLFGRLILTVLQGKPVHPKIETVARIWRPALLPVNRHYWMLADAKLSRTLAVVFGSSVL